VKIDNFFGELKRRNVLKVAIAYIVGGWALSQGIAQVFPVFDIPNWVIRLIVLLIIIGLPIALVLAWSFEITPQGIKRTEDVDLVAAAQQPKKRTWIVVVIIGALVSIGLFFLGRYTVQTPRPASAELRRGEQSEAATGIREKSIAVLPFVNMSGNAANNDFSDGITEEILNALAQISGLKVAARTSAFQFKGKNVDLRRIGETLGVAYVLEGSVQRAGDDLRITAQLNDARSGYHLWSEKYDRKLTSIFAVEDEISKAIAAQMRVTLSGNPEEPLVKPATADPQAHEFYLKGLAQITERGPGLTSAVEFFKQAIALDPKYAAAWAGLGQAYELLPWYKFAPWQTSLAQAQEAAQQALSRDPQLAEAHTALANVLRDRFDFADATKEYQTALERNPGSVETLNQYAQMLQRMGRFEEAAKQERTAVALDPLAPNPRYILATALGNLHRYDEAIAEEKVVVARSPNYAYARFYLAYLYLYASNYEEAEKEARAAAAQVDEDPEVIATLIHAVTNPELRASASKLVSEGKIGRYDLRGVTDPFWYTLLGAYDEALESLQQWLATTQEGQLFADIGALWRPAFDPIRGDERFQAIMKSARLPTAPIHPERTP
jgi:adenylate cyclase